MRRTALALAAACLAVTAASAADWPTKPVRIIAPFAAGGAADALGRLVAEPLSDVFKEQFFVENRGGAGGRIGELAGAKAEPDGYTLVISAMSASVVAPASTPNIGYDPMKDFTHIAYLGGSPNVLVVHPSLPARNFKDLLAYLKSHKEGTGYISAGLGTAGNLLAEALARKENFKIDHIPYKGAGPAMVDLVAGHVKLGSVTWSSALTQIKAGKVLPLAVSSAARMPEAPEIPTLKELGYPDLVSVTWFGLSAPAGLPKDIVEKLNREATKALQTPALKAKLASEGFAPEPMLAAEYSAFVASELAKWGPLAKALMMKKK